MFDITKHKWDDDNISSVDIFNNHIDLNMYGFRHSEDADLRLSKDDSTAITRHFYNQMTKTERINFWGEIFEDSVNNFIDIPQSEATYKSLNLDSVAVMRESELFNKEDDLHG